MLFDATDDRLHQRQREVAYPESFELVRQLRDSGLAAMISGAGPAVIVLATRAAVPSIPVPSGWTVSEVPVDVLGARVLPLPA